MDDLERDIFEAGNEPPSGPEPLVDEATSVREGIREMQRGGGREPQAPAQPPPSHGVDDQSPAGLLRGMLDERDKRQNLERQLQRYQEMERESQRRAKETEQPFDQRFFSAPQQELDSLFTARLSPIEQRMQNMAADFDMRLARKEHGPVFDEAFQEWFNEVGDLSRPNPPTYFAVMNSPSPGEALMQWFTDRKDRREIGDGGLSAYKERVRAEVMAELGMSPSVLNAPAPERPRDPQNGQYAPRHEVRLPTSLSRLGAAGRGTPEPAEDGSEAAIFDAGRPERRR